MLRRFSTVLLSIKRLYSFMPNGLRTKGSERKRKSSLRSCSDPSIGKVHPVDTIVHLAHIPVLGNLGGRRRGAQQYWECKNETCSGTFFPLSVSLSVFTPSCYVYLIPSGLRYSSQKQNACQTRAGLARYPQKGRIGMIMLLSCFSSGCITYRDVVSV